MHACEWERGTGKFRKHSKKLFWAEKTVSASFDRKLEEAIRAGKADVSLARFLGIDPHKHTIEWKANWLKQHMTYLNYDFKKDQWVNPSKSGWATASHANGFLSSAKGIIEAVRQEART